MMLQEPDKIYERRYSLLTLRGTESLRKCEFVKLDLIDDIGKALRLLN